MVINILTYLENAVATNDSKTAIVDEKSSITYSDLKRASQGIGSTIIERFQGKTNQPIVVFVDRNLESIVSFFGVAYSGNFYVPIDINMPTKRIELILDTLNPVGIIGTPGSETLISEVAPNLEKLGYTDAIGHMIDEDGLADVRRRHLDLNPLYATFTSGSTGVPKGVLTCHQSVIDMTEALVETFDFDSNHVFGNQNPFYFDASIKDIYSSIRCGATLYIIPKSYFLHLGNLVDYLLENKVDTILWSAAAIALLANSKAFEDKVPSTLKKVMFSGEVMHNKVLNYWRRKLPETKFVNLYGPTEITSVCTYYKIEKPFDDDEVLPIGRPFRNCDALILNENNQLVGKGETGELCIKGACLALGYYNNPSKTAEVFCQNPLNTNYPERIYRTGDLASYNELGEIMFMSRKDNQVKHMGQRVELGEIEIILNSLEKIDTSICFYDNDKQKIVCFYQGLHADKKYIFNELKTRVSKFMFPNVLIKKDEFPYNLNGKVDRVQLKELYFKGE